MRFINRESGFADIRSDLRPFLEVNFLPHFYIEMFKEFAESDTPFGNVK